MRFSSKLLVLGAVMLLGAGCTKPAANHSSQAPQVNKPATTTPVEVPVVDRPVTVRFVDQVEQYAVEFPEKLYIQRSGEGTTLVHAIPFTHEEPCNQKETVTIPLLTDYKVTLSTLPKNQLADWVTKHRSPEFAKEHLQKDWFKIDGESIKEVVIGSRKGVQYDMGVEGCGLSTYILPLTSSTLLVAEQPFGNITSPMFGPDEVTEKARQLPGVILNEDLNKFTEQILASLTTVQSTGSIAGFIRPASSSEMIAYSSENNFSFRYPGSWAVQVTPRSYAVDYDIVPNLEVGLIAPPAFQSANRLSLKSAASIFINAETDGFTVNKESVPTINGKEWNQADYIRLPGGPTTERRIIAIGPHLVREDLGFLVQLNYPLDKEVPARAMFERVLNTLGPRP